MAKNDSMILGPGVLQRIVEDSINEIYIFDAETLKFVFVNKGARDNLGYTNEELSRLHAIDIKPEYNEASYREHIRPLLNGQTNLLIYETVHKRKNGSVYNVEVRLEQITEKDKAYFCAIILDVTERKLLENKLRRAKRMEAVGQLTGGIAHDFNNILAVMIGNTEMLESRMQHDNDALRQLETIKRAVDRASSLTDRLLAFSRQQTLAPISTNVSVLIGGLKEMLQRTLGEAIDLRVCIAQNAWNVIIDPLQFENALVNLCLNARDAMPKGGVLTIESLNTSLDETYTGFYDEVLPGDYVTVTVSDTGQGISNENLEKVFEPFFTTKPVGEGSGLGLSMVYGFVKQSKGHITIYSEVGFGSTVKLYLPRSTQPATPRKAEQNILAKAIGTESILIVEDDVNVRNIPATILSEAGYKIVEASNGAEAIKTLKSGIKFDLLFTDVVLPGGMSGADIAAEARQLQPGIKILYTTGYTANAILHHGKLDAGVNLINKPYRKAELLSKVRSVIDSISVLLVEDDDDLRNTLKSVLEEAGYIVATASGGRDGLITFKSYNFEVVVTDIIMEHGEGIETLRWIKEVSPSTPVIAISAHDNLLGMLVKLGAYAGLLKPFKNEDLISSIRDAAGNGLKKNA